jgi:hypothetical protein
MNQYTANTLVRLSVAVATIADSAIDPTTVTMKVKLPDNSVSDQTANVVKDSTGNYHVDYLPTQTGTYTYEWIGTGAAQVSTTGKFLVSPGTF